MLDPGRHRLAIFMEGAFGHDYGKMGYGVLRYSPCEIACVIDSCAAGKETEAIVPTGRSVPIVRSLPEAIQRGAQVLVLGIAPPGGRTPESWLAVLDEAIARGMSIVNGLHLPLGPRYPDLTDGQWVWDIRQEPEGLSTATGAAIGLPNRRILFVGTDMAVGKMTASLELWKTAKTRGVDAAYVATGQTGITVTGSGVPLDAVRVDYAGGAIEREVMRLAKAEWIIIEGQGSLAHPASTATLPLLRGSMATDLVLCCDPAQTTLKSAPEFPAPKIPPLIDLCERLATADGQFPAAKVLAIAANTVALDAASARAAIEKLQNETGLPVQDVIRDRHADRLFEAIQNR